jgi:hypothetical protein
MGALKSVLKLKSFSVSFCIVLFLFTILVYFFTSEGKPTAYNNFVLLADAFLRGRLHLTENIPWLELAVFEGKYYVMPPPMPAVLLLPLVAVFGVSLNQVIVSIFLGSLNVALAFLIAKEITKNRTIQIWSTVMFGFGTIHWYLASTGWVWFFSQVVSVTFLFLAIYATLRSKNFFLIGIFLGASYWSRLPTILSLPFFIIMLSDKWFKTSTGLSVFERINLKPLFHLGLGVLIFVGLNSIYNFLRFHTPFDASYYLQPGLLETPIYLEGIFDISYIPRHIKVVFASLPVFQSEFPYVIPPWGGLSIWITTPAFVYALFAGIRNRLALACWISIILIALVEFTHGGVGAVQFGYRFAVDFYPFLYLLTVRGIGDEIKWHHKTLIAIGVLVNLWGVIFINKFGWVRF